MKKVKQKSTVDAEKAGYFAGGHRISKNHGLESIERGIKERQARAREEHIQKTAKLETEAEDLKRRLPDLRSGWATVRQELGDHPPGIAWATTYLVAAVALMGADTTFLRPAMDMFDITNPAMQSLAAGVFSVAGAVPLAFALNRHLAKARRIFAGAIAGLVALFALVPLALLRPAETIFGLRFESQVTDAAHPIINPTATFLAAHPALARIFFLGLTLGIPLVAALALDYAVESFQAKSRWKRAHDQLESAETRVQEIEGELKEQHDSLPHRLEQIQHDGAQIAADYTRGHELGQRRVGQPPRWMSMMKAVTAAAVVAVVATLFGLSLWKIVLSALGAGAVYFAIVEHRRVNPSMNSYWKTRAICADKAPVVRTPEIVPTNVPVGPHVAVPPPVEQSYVNGHAGGAVPNSVEKEVQ